MGAQSDNATEPYVDRAAQLCVADRALLDLSAHVLPRAPHAERVCAGQCVALVSLAVADADRALEAWEKQVLSARGFKRLGRHSEYAI